MPKGVLRNGFVCAASNASSSWPSEVFPPSILVLSTSVLPSVDAQVRNHLQENVRHNPEGCYSLLRIYEQESLARAQRFAERDTLIKAMRSGEMDREGIQLLDRLIRRIEHKK